jgi:hypothetical protein
VSACEIVAVVGDTDQRSRPHDERWELVRQRLVDDGVAPERADALADEVLQIADRDRHHLPHPIRSAEHEVEHLREVADEGESAATPAIVAGGLLAVLIPLALVMIAAVVLIAYFVTRGAGSSESTAAPVPWTLPNGDLFNTRNTQQTQISAATVSELGVAWTMPLTAISTYGTFAANPVTSPDGTVYLQDLESNVSAVDLETGQVLWTRLQLAGHRPKRGHLCRWKGVRRDLGVRFRA